jgi:isopenicillin-N N-acyltransferase-like protein
VAHNEDWSEADVPNMVLVAIRDPDGTEILSVTGAGYLPVTGLNGHGLAIAANTLYAIDERAGVPNQFVGRSMLSAATAADAVERARHPARARGANRLAGEAGGRLCDVETSATRSATSTSSDWLVHTNHYLADELGDVEGSTSAGSRRRVERAEELVAVGWARGDDPLALAAAVLRDHDGAPTSICSHPLAGDPGHAPTTASMIWELDERRMHVCAGRPCEGGSPKGEPPYAAVAID